MRNFDEYDFVSAHWRMIDGFKKGWHAGNIAVGQRDLGRMVFFIAS